MILVSLIYNREILRFAIQDRIIKYTDRKWGKWIQCIPKDRDFIKQIILSRGKFPHSLIKMFNLSVKEQAEYDAAKTDEELALIIMRDAKLKGCKSATKEYRETAPQMQSIKTNAERPIQDSQIKPESSTNKVDVPKRNWVEIKDPKNVLNEHENKK